MSSHPATVPHRARRRVWVAQRAVWKVAVLSARHRVEVLAIAAVAAVQAADQARD